RWPTGVYHPPQRRQRSVQVLGVAYRFKRIEGVETFTREIENVKVGDGHAHAPAKRRTSPPADVRLHRGISHAHDFDSVPAGEGEGRPPPPAPQPQQPHVTHSL